MTSVRRALECNVVAHNKYLEGKLKAMSLIILLRNAHPTDRSDFAHSLFNCGSITKAELAEFNSPLRSHVLFGRQ